MKTRIIIISIIIMAVIAAMVFGLGAITHNFERTDTDIKTQIEEYAQASDVEKLLILNQINYRPNRLVVTSGISFSGDPGCGAVMDTNNQTHWFAINSVSQPTRITLYSENPQQCKVNTHSCFCYAQMELTVLTLEKLSYFTMKEEEKFANMLIDYLEKENINRTPKFLIGKFNLNYTDPSAIGYCGELWGKNTFDYFQGSILDSKVVGFEIGDKLPKLCAINKDAQYFGKVLGEE